MFHICAAFHICASRKPQAEEVMQQLQMLASLSHFSQLLTTPPCNEVFKTEKIMDLIMASAFFLSTNCFFILTSGGKLKLAIKTAFKQD